MEKIVKPVVVIVAVVLSKTGCVVESEDRSVATMLLLGLEQ